MSETIWLNGDKWRDFSADLHKPGIYSILTENGTIRILDTERYWQKRIPLTHAMEHDNKPQELYSIHIATPCGLLTFSSQTEYHCTTNVLAVTTGDNVDLLQGLYEPIKSITRTSFGHPQNRCGALHCSYKDVVADANC